MAKRLIITEDDKTYIKKLYGLINEQVVSIPDNILEYTPEQWATWHQQTIEDGFLKGTLRKPVKNRLKTDKEIENLFLIDGIRSIVRPEEDKKVLQSMERFIRNPYRDDSSKWESVVMAFDVFQNMANQVYEKWNDSYEKDMVLSLTEKNIQEEGTPVGGTVEFVVDWNPDSKLQLYVNNLWDVGPAFTESFNSRVLSRITKMKEDYPSVQISLISLSIETSASRYRNTGQAAGLTFQELSGYRNNSAKEYIINSLQEYGVKGVNDVTVEQKYLGVNEDGTTGPNPPEPNAYVDGGNVKMNTTPTQPRNQFGEPHPTPEEYDQYKYLKVKIKLSATSPNPVAVIITKKIFEYTLVIAGDKIIPPPPIKIKRPNEKPKFKFLRKIADTWGINHKDCAAYD
jgi:hypothetical protein